MKHIEIVASDRSDNIQMIFRQAWGKHDRYLIITPQEAKRLSAALYDAAHEPGERFSKVCDFASSAND